MSTKTDHRPSDSPPANGSAADPRMTLLRSLPLQVAVNWIVDAASEEIGIRPSTFALGVDARFRTTTPLEMFDLCAGLIREHVASRQSAESSDAMGGRE